MDATAIINSFLDQITPGMWVVAAAVYGICYALKRAKFFDDRFIPLAAVVLGVVLEVAAAAMFSREIVVEAIIRGVSCGMAAVFAANVIKQAKEGKNDDEYSA